MNACLTNRRFRTDNDFSFDLDLRIGRRTDENVDFRRSFRISTGVRIEQKADDIRREVVIQILAIHVVNLGIADLSETDRRLENSFLEQHSMNHLFQEFTFDNRV